MGLFLGLLSCSTDLYFCFCVLITVAMKYSLKSGSLIPPVPFFFCRITLAIRGLLYFHTNLKIFCSSSVKNVKGILIGIALNLKISLGSMAIVRKLILLIHEHGSSFHFFVSTNFLQQHVIVFRV